MNLSPTCCRASRAGSSISRRSRWDRCSASVTNRLDLSEEQLLHNLHLVQQANGIALDPGLQWIEETIRTAGGDQQVRFANFSVEMETGTGKTYVYLRTALELNRRYGLRKFIVVVPSVAVREGVIKTLKITQEHLRALYDNVPYRYHGLRLEEYRQGAAVRTERLR